MVDGERAEHRAVHRAHVCQPRGRCVQHRRADFDRRAVGVRADRRAALTRPTSLGASAGEHRRRRVVGTAVVPVPSRTGEELGGGTRIR